MKQKQQDAEAELEELKRKREERKKILEEEERQRKKEQEEKKVKEQVRITSGNQLHQSNISFSQKCINNRFLYNRRRERG